MRNIMSKMLLGVFFISINLPGITKKVETQATIIPPTPQEFLKQEIERQGLGDRDYAILTEIIRCESSWSQFWERDYEKLKRVKGEVKVSNGNIGLMQINRGAHKKEYTALGLDPFKEFDNISYGIMLYKRNGVRDWENWSGHCWKPLLVKQGIKI